MYWGPRNSQADGYAEEIAAFVLERSGAHPAVLWPEHDPAPPGTAPPDDLGARLAARLTDLMGRAVEELPAGPDPDPPHPGGTPLSTDQGALLLVQVRGSSSVRIASVGVMPLRVCPGEVLFLPEGTRGALDHQAGPRRVLLRIAPEPPSAGGDRTTPHRL